MIAFFVFSSAHHSSAHFVTNSSAHTKSISLNSFNDLSWILKAILFTRNNTASVIQVSSFFFSLSQCFVIILCISNQICHSMIFVKCGITWIVCVMISVSKNLSLLLSTFKLVWFLTSIQSHRHTYIIFIDLVQGLKISRKIKLIFGIS